MEDSRNQPELETLSYAPECKCEICEEAKQKILKTEPIPPANIGFNSAVIKPETRVNKTENAEEPLEQPHPCNYVNQQRLTKQSNQTHCPNCGQEWKTHDYTCKDNKAEQPNQNLMIIEEIEGLMSQVNDNLYKLNVLIANKSQSTKHKDLIHKALEEIDLFQKTTLFELRREFE